MLPGFGLSMGYTLLYLGLLVLFRSRRSSLKASALGPREFCGAWSPQPRALAAYKLSFGASLASAVIERVPRAAFGLGAGALPVLRQNASWTRSSTCRSRCPPRWPASP